MIREYLGFDLSEYRDGNMAKGVVYGSLGACVDALPWFMVALGLPYVLGGGNGFASAVALAVSVVGFVLGVFLKTQALNANFDATYAVVSNARLRLANHLARLPLGRVLSQRDGAWAELVTAQFTMYQDIVTNIWGCVVAGTAFPLLLWLLLLWLNWACALVMLAAMPLAMLSVPLAYRLLDRASEKVASSRQMAAVNALEIVTGARDLRFFDPRGQRVAAARRAFELLRDESLKSEVAPAPALLIFSLVVFLGASLAIGVASLRFIGGGAGAVAYFVEILVVLRLAMGINDIGIYLAAMRFVGSILNRIRRVFDEPVMPQAVRGQIPRDGSVDMQNVSFGYGDAEVIHNVSFRIESGSMAALVGPSGSGKSTLASLVARLWDVEQGAVRIGGVDVRDIDEPTLHKTVSMVLQDVFLFPMSVADNIRLGKPEAPMDKVIEAAEAACIHERVMQLPEGYDAVLETGDVVLSGGERQRVAIARAILQDAPVLILDEATSSLDLENEAAVQRALSNLCRGKTVIVIAHRLWTVHDADKIFVLEKGKIVEHGSHADLLSAEGLYAGLWGLQQGI